MVLDNCEHLIAAVRSLLEPLLARAPGLTALATSRARLGMEAERSVPLAPLGLPTPGAPDVAHCPAVEMFLDRAHRVQPGLGAGDDELVLVAELCRRLDGLPLALELAAGRLAALGLTDLCDRLDRALDVLGSEDTDDRHRTMRAVIDWSYGLLDERSRRLFERLAVFDGGFTLAAAEQVAGPDDGGIAGTLARLVEASMVAVDRSSGGGRLRYQLLQTLRAYAADRLAAREDADAAARRHTRWVVDFTEAAGRGLRTADEGAWARRVDAELANIRSGWHRAFSAGDLDSAARIVLALRSYVAWRWSGQTELYQRARSLLDAPALAGSAHEPAVHGVAAEAAFAQGDLDTAEALARRALERSEPAAAGRWRCLYGLGLVALLRGDNAATERWWLEAADSPDAPESERISNRANVALPRLRSGDVDGARAALAPLPPVRR